METSIDPIEQLNKLDNLRAEAEAKLLEAENQQYIITRDYIEQGSNLEEKLKLASFLYWNADSVKSTTICKALGIKSINKKGYGLLISHCAPSTRTVCRRCDKPLAIIPRSRNHLKILREESKAEICHECRREQDHEAEKRFEAEKANCLSRLSNHKLMSMARKMDFSKANDHDLVYDGIRLMLDATYCGYLSMSHYEICCHIRNKTELKDWAPDQEQVTYVKSGLMAIE